jgi:hypothetical protein
MWAQAGGGSMVGTVHDPAGAVVPNAAVTITNTNTNSTYPVATNGDGRFLYPQLPVGTYKLSVTAPGFKEAVQEGITVSIGTMSTLNIALQVGQTSQSVSVTANAQQIQTESSDVGTTVPGALVAQLPLNFSGVIRSPLQFTVIRGEAEESAVPRTFRGKGILSSNRIVISTEAQRSGEICGLAP